MTEPRTLYEAFVAGSTLRELADRNALTLADVRAQLDRAHCDYHADPDSGAASSIELREQRLERLDAERRALVAERLDAAKRAREQVAGQVCLPGLEPAWSSGLCDPPPAVIDQGARRR